MLSLFAVNLCLVAQLVFCDTTVSSTSPSGLTSTLSSSSTTTAWSSLNYATPTTSKVTSSGSAGCTYRSQYATCTLADPPAQVSFRWPKVTFDGTVTIATVTYKVNPNDGSTTTITGYNNLTSTSSDDGVQTFTAANDVGFWNSKLSTTGVSLSGDVPVLTLTATVYTKPDAYTTIKTVLPSPSSYYNAGWLYATLPLHLTPPSNVADPAVCTWTTPGITSALTPTATPAGYANAYESPLDIPGWLAAVSAVPGNDCIYVATTTTHASQVAVSYVSALTETTTIYDEVVHSQITKSATASAASVAVAPASKAAVATGGNAATSQARGTATPSATAIVIASQTIAPGASAVTISGTTYSLATSGSVLVVDGSTLTVAGSRTATSGLGGLIYSGLNGGTITANVVPAAYTGSSTSLYRERVLGWLILPVLMLRIW